MSGHHEVIVLDSSSDDSESETEFRITVRKAVAPVKKTTTTKKKKSVKPSPKPRVFGDYVLTRDEEYLLAADEDDESDASADEDDDYDDRDDSFGDGARAFARKRRRPTEDARAAKRTKTPMRVAIPSRPKPPPSRAPVRREQSDSDSGDLSDDLSMDDDDDGPFRHLTMVRKMEKARAMRAQINGKSTTPKAPPRRADARPQVTAKAGTKQPTNGLTSKTERDAMKRPLAARKSVPKLPAPAIAGAQRSRRKEDSEYEEEESSEEEESDDSEITRGRYGQTQVIEEIEISDEDSASQSDSEEPDSEDQSSSRYRQKKKVASGAASRTSLPGSLQKKKPQEKKVVKAAPKSKAHQKTTPSVQRSPPPQKSLPAPLPRQEQIPTSRSARAVAALPENMSIEDMQAQERQLAYFKQLQKRKEQLSQPASSSNGSRSRSSSSGVRSTNIARKPVSTQRVYRLQRQDSGASVESHVSSATSRTGSTSSSKEPKQSARTKTQSYFVPPALREGFSTMGTRHVMTTVSVAADASKSFATAEKVDHVPLLHNTAWRERLQFVRAPLNILPYKQGHDSKRGIFKVEERELCEFDDSGLIAPLADLTSPPQISTDEVLTQTYETQEAVNNKVRRVIDKSLPVLKQCHHRRVQDIIIHMRKSLPWYSASAETSALVNVSRARSSAPQVCPGSDPAPIERVHAKRILHASLSRVRTKQPNRLVGTIRYIIGSTRRKDAQSEEYEDLVHEISRFPETIIEFGEDIAPMRQSCTWISVKTNIHVEDDPILRYIPYLGDKGRVNIDPKRYQSTSLNKDEAIVIELPEGDASDSEDPIKTQERLESWRNDTANLVVATRSAMDDEVMEYLLCMVIKECGRSPKVFQALRDIGGFAEPITDFDVIQKREETARSISKRIKDLHLCLNAETDGAVTMDGEVRKYVSQLVRTSNMGPGDESVSQKLRAPLSAFSSNYLQYPDCKGLRQGKSFGQVSEWYRDLFCRRCFLYDCQQHGIQYPQPSQRMDPVNPVVKKSGIGLLRAKRGSDSTDVIEVDSSSSSSSAEGDADGDNGDDVQSTISGSVEGEDEAADTADHRRSRRSQTRASTLASASLKVQEVMVEKERKRHQRKQAKQLRRLVRQVDDSEYLDDSYRDIVASVMDTLISPAPDSSCGVFCRKRSAQLSDDSSSSNFELSDVLKLVLRKVVPILGDNSCLIARLCQQPGSGKPVDPIDSCAAIHRYIEDEKKKTDGSSLFSSTSYQDRSHDKSEYRRQNNPRRSSAALHSGNRELVKRTRMNRAQQQTKEREHRYEPCNHNGECNDGNCECLKRGHDCDKACSCSRDCANRNHGCSCVAGQCRTKACSCYSAGRECDPDFCFSCGAHEAAVMEFDDKQRVAAASDVGICRNVNLLRGVHKKIGVAFSATHGWGAYALEPIRKGDFVYEYRGALISDDEAERRGNIYDAIKVSYLFDVNSDEVVDAMRKGNKIKFANHRMQEVANLETKILVVHGEHRIALFAKWDLHVGEELFFDYGYTNETAPEWSQLRNPHNPRYADSDLEDDDEELKEVLRLQANENEDDDDDL